MDDIRGRGDFEFKPLTVDMGIAKVGNGRVEGSARYCSGKTVVSATASGPLTSAASTKFSLSDVQVNVKAVVKPVVGPLTDSERDIEERIVRFVLGVLDPSCPPRTALTIIVQILSSDGSLLACIFNVVTLALLDAGIPLCGSPACVSFAITQQGKFWLEPDYKEEQNSQARSTYCFLFKRNAGNSSHFEPCGLIYVSTQGNMGNESILSSFSSAERACAQLLDFISSVLSENSCKI